MMMSYVCFSLNISSKNSGYEVGSKALDTLKRRDADAMSRRFQLYAGPSEQFDVTELSQRCHTVMSHCDMFVIRLWHQYLTTLWREAYINITYICLWLKINLWETTTYILFKKYISVLTWLWLIFDIIFMMSNVWHHCDIHLTSHLWWQMFDIIVT